MTLASPTTKVGEARDVAKAYASGFGLGQVLRGIFGETGSFLHVLHPTSAIRRGRLVSVVYKSME